MRKKLHPLSGAVYEDLGEGRVRVMKGGVEGIFEAHSGRWLEGELTYADPHMITWVGGKTVPMMTASGRPRGGTPEMAHD